MRTLAVVAAVAVAVAACSQPQNQPAGRQGGQGAASTASDTSPQMKRLFAAATIALPPGIPADSLPEPTSVGAQTLQKYCVQCHALPSPNMHSAVDWPIVLRRMWTRIDMMHGALGVQTPTVPERIQLANYLTAHALPVPSSLPAGPYRELFSQMCSRCHALPDPRAHTSADWPAVVTRMEQHMQQMKVSVPSREQSQQIVLYLDGASQRR